MWKRGEKRGGGGFPKKSKSIEVVTEYKQRELRWMCVKMTRGIERWRNRYHVMSSLGLAALAVPLVHGSKSFGSVLAPPMFNPREWSIHGWIEREPMRLLKKNILQFSLT